MHVWSLQGCERLPQLSRPRCKYGNRGWPTWRPGSSFSSAYSWFSASDQVCALSMELCKPAVLPAVPHVPCNSRPSWRRNRCRLLILPPPLTVRVLAHFSLWPQAPLPGQHRGLRRAVLVPAREDELCSFCLSCCRFGEDGNDDARRLIRLGACPAEKLSQLMAENRCPRR